MTRSLYLFNGSSAPVEPTLYLFLYSAAWKVCGFCCLCHTHLLSGSNLLSASCQHTCSPSDGGHVGRSTLDRPLRSDVPLLRRPLYRTASDRSPSLKRPREESIGVVFGCVQSTDFLGPTIVSCPTFGEGTWGWWCFWGV